MKGKRVLFIRYKTREKILEGGSMLSETNLAAIKRVVGENNVDEYAVHDPACKMNLCHKLFGILYFLKDMHWGLSPKKLEQITLLALDYDVVYIDRSIFGIIAKKLRERGFNGKIITYFHNFEPQYFRDKICKWLPFRNVIINCVRHNEKMACRCSDTVIAINRRDGELIAGAYHRRADALVHVSFKNSYSPGEGQKERRFENPPLCLFFGSYFPANSEGVLWFVHEVLPHVNIRLQIIGKGMEALRGQLPKSHKIELLGGVADLKEYLENADIMVLPIFKGSGMKVKTCEAMMYGKHIIGSSETFEGYDVDFDKVGALANTKEEYIEAIKRLCATRHKKYNAYSRDFFLENHSIETTENKFRTILDPPLPDEEISVL